MGETGMQTYPRTIAANGASEIIVKKSRFICTLARAASEDEARAVIETVRKRHWDAGHHCTAYRIGLGGQFQRSSDDGEPSGTAGAPMLAVLNHRALIDVVAVVTRYFGGVLLGTGGLIRAYGQAVTDAIDGAGIVERRPVALVAVEADYDDAGRLENALRAGRFQLGPVSHGAHVTFEVHLADADVPDFSLWLAEATNGRSQAAITRHLDVEVPVERG